MFLTVCKKVSSPRTVTSNFSDFRREILQRPGVVLTVHGKTIAEGERGGRSELSGVYGLSYLHVKMI